MEVVALLLFVAAVWVFGALALFAWNLRTRAHEHADRLAMLPLEDNWTDPCEPRAASASPNTSGERK
jgi:hypothetical protein